MRALSVRRCGGIVLVAMLAFAPGAAVFAQTPELKGGFEVRAIAAATGEELSRQTGLWILEVELKPMRLVRVDVTDPKTGKKAREIVWYLCYKAVNRPLIKKEDAENISPQNDYDPEPGRPLFVPEFTLVTDDGDKQTVHQDQVVPEAQAAILKRESRRADGPKYRNSVQVVGELPEAVDGEAPQDKAIWGVAMFRGIDPATDAFTLYLTGFSNAYKVMPASPDDAGEPLVMRKTLIQKFARPGDEFDLSEAEFRLVGDPVWDYRPDDVRVDVDDAPKPPAVAPADKADENAN